MNNIPYTKEQLMKANAKLMDKNKQYREALKLLAKQETLGKDRKTRKIVVSHNGKIALEGLGEIYIVYGVDEIINIALEESE